MGNGLIPIPPGLITDVQNQLGLEGITTLPAPTTVDDDLFLLRQALFFNRILSGNEDVA